MISHCAKWHLNNQKYHPTIKMEKWCGSKLNYCFTFVERKKEEEKQKENIIIWMDVMRFVDSISNESQGNIVP